MNTSIGPYVCPDCNAVHTDPVEAACALHVRCAGCVLELEIARWLAPEASPLPEAA